AAIGVGLLAAASALSGASCSSDADCLSTRTYFEQNVWSAFMSTTCTKCHAPDGVAVTKSGAKLILEPAAYPGFIDKNLDTLREVTKIEDEGSSELLQKPLGKMAHGGGAVLKDDSPEYKALTELVDRFGASGDSCKTPPGTA